MEGESPIVGLLQGAVSRTSSMSLASTHPSQVQATPPGSPPLSLTQSSPRSTHTRRENTIRSRRSLYPSSAGSSGSVASEQRSIKRCLKDILSSTRLNYFLIFFPLAIIANQLNLPSALVFAFSVIAILPLAKLHDLIGDEFNFRLGKTPGILFAFSLGNVIELILSIFVLKQGKIEVVKISIVGSIVFKLLLILGSSFAYGGYLHKDQTYTQKAAQASASLMSMIYLLLLIPAAFKLSGANLHISKVQYVSYGMSIVILMVYFFYLVFQLKTHTHFYHHHWTANPTPVSDRPVPVWPESESATQEPVPEEEPTKKKPLLPLPVAVVTFLIITGGVAYCADIMASSMNVMSDSWHTNPTFVGLIVLPFVGNAVELVDAVSLAKKNKMDLAIEVAIGSSMQTALFIAPLMVLIGWCIGQPITLFFAPFQTGVLFVSVLTVNHIIQDGKGDWLRGAILILSYAIVSLAMYCYPTF